MRNETNMKIAKKYQPFIREIWYEGEDGYWASLKECCICDDTESHYVHEDTQKRFLKSLQSIRIMGEKEYRNHFGLDLLDRYHDDLIDLVGGGK